MKQVLTILLFLLLTNLSRGQSPSFFVDGARWVYHTYESGEPGQQFVHNSDEQNIIHGDTVIEGFTYQKLYTTHHYIREVHLDYPVPHTLYQHSYDSIGPSFLRYDTLIKKVYYLAAVDSTERLIYDFTLQVGDTVPMQPENFPTTIIRDIDTVSFFGVSLTRFFIGEQNQSWIDPRNYIVEGIGGSNGLTYIRPEWDVVSGGYFGTRIECFQYQDSIYGSWYGECPFIDFISATKDISTDLILKVGPNPTTDEFSITISEELLGSTFTLVDFLGRVIQTSKLSGTNTITRLGTPGMYFWNVQKDGQFVGAGKIVYE